MLGGEEMAQKLGEQRWDLWLKFERRCCRLWIVGNNASSTQKTWKSPVVRSPERCRADASSKKGLVSQRLAPLGFASAAESCLAQHLPRMATSNDWQWWGDHSPAISGHSYPMQDISNWLELCQAWAAIWLLFLSNPPSSAFLPWVRIANHSLASQTLSGYLNCDTYVPGKASSWCPPWKGRWSECTLVIQRRLLVSLWERLILLPNFFHAITCKKVFYLGSSLREMKEVAWVGRTGSESITCPIGWGYPWNPFRTYWLGRSRPSQRS